MDLPYIPKNTDERRVLPLYSTAMEVCTEPEPLMTAEQVRSLIEATAEAFSTYVIQNGMEEIYPPQIPVGGEIITGKILEKSRPKLEKEGIVVYDPFDLPISRYGEGGTTGKEARLPDDFELPATILNVIQNRELPTGEDISDKGDTLIYAHRKVTEWGARGLVPFIIFERVREKRKYPRDMKIGYVAYFLDTVAWLLGATSLDVKGGYGRNLEPLYAAKPHVVHSMKPSEIRRLGKKQREERRIFNHCVDELKGITVNGKPARTFIERDLPLMTLEQLNLYQDI